MTALEWMQKEAKKIRKQHPNMAWISVMKKAGVAYRAKNGTSSKRKVGAYKVVERGESTKTKPSAVYKNVRSKSGEVKKVKKIGSVNSYMNAARRLVIDQIGKLEALYIVASSKSDKNRVRKLINEKKAVLRRLTIK